SPTRVTPRARATTAAAPRSRRAPRRATPRARPRPPTRRSPHWRGGAGSPRDRDRGRRRSRFLPRLSQPRSPREPHLALCLLLHAVHWLPRHAGQRGALRLRHLAEEAAQPPCDRLAHGVEPSSAHAAQLGPRLADPLAEREAVGVLPRL